MSARLTQSVIEALLLGSPAARLTQLVIEAVISDIVTPAKTRITQSVIEVILSSVTPPTVTTRYGPRIQSV